MNATSVHAQANKHILLQSDNPQNPEFSWLKRFLRLRGYHPESKHPTQNTISLKLTSPSTISISRGQHSQRYQLPNRLQAPQLRARMITMYLELFLNAHPIQTSATKAKEPTEEPPSILQERRSPPPKRLSQTPKPQKKQRRTRLNSRRLSRKKARPLRHPGSKRKLHSPPKRELLAPLRPDERKNTPPRLEPPRALYTHPTPPQPSVSSPERALPPTRKAPQRTKPMPRFTPRKTPPARRLRKLAQHRPPQITVPSQKQGLWGRVFSLDLGVGGGLRWSNFERIHGGGSLSIGLNAWRWTLRLELDMHAFGLSLQKRSIFLLRPSLWLGWKLPLEALTTSFELQLLAGLCSEFFVTEKSDPTTKYYEHLQWGAMVGLQLHWWFTRRWSLYARPALLLFPGGFNVALSQDKWSWSPPLQLVGLLGIQVRF